MQKISNFLHLKNKRFFTSQKQEIFYIPKNKINFYISKIRDFLHSKK
jgi:hypothetical protein